MAGVVWLLLAIDAILLRRWQCHGGLELCRAVEQLHVLIAL
jgi:hypothetical protein